MKTPRHHYLVCLNSRAEGGRGSCDARGAQKVFDELNARVLANADLARNVQVSGTTCLGLCSQGPIVALYPDDSWYGDLKPDDVDALLYDMPSLSDKKLNQE